MNDPDRKRAWRQARAAVRASGFYRKFGGPPDCADVSARASWDPMVPDDVDLGPLSG